MSTIAHRPRTRSFDAAESQKQALIADGAAPKKLRKGSDAGFEKSGSSRGSTGSKKGVRQYTSSSDDDADDDDAAVRKAASKKEKKEKKEKSGKKEKKRTRDSEDEEPAAAVDSDDESGRKRKDKKKDKKKRKGDSEEEEEEIVTVTVATGTTVDEEKGALSNFPLSPSTLGALKQKGIKALFPIQYVTFSHVLKGKDVIARARTGTGKTLAFALPIIEQVLKGNLSDGSRGRVPLAIVLVPTRELAIQVCDDFKLFAPSLVSLCVYGGASIETQVRTTFLFDRWLPCVAAAQLPVVARVVQ
jgi:ATP-dependent RNA helicase DDX21